MCLETSSVSARRNSGVFTGGAFGEEVLTVNDGVSKGDTGWFGVFLDQNMAPGVFVRHSDEEEDEKRYSLLFH